MSSQDEFPPYDPLLATLLDLLFDLEEHGADIPLILGGGYGLYLKQQHLTVSNAHRLYPGTLRKSRRAANSRS